MAGGAYRLIEQKRTIGMRLESAANQYTNNEVLTAADYCVPAYEITYSPAVEEAVRKLARGDYSMDASVMGRRTFECTFKVDMQTHATANQAPMYWIPLRACALKQTTYSTTGVNLVTDATVDRTPMTIEVVERQEGATPKQLVVRAFGCMGNPKIVCDQIGRAPHIEFSFRGALASITTRAYASIITPASFDTSLPSACLAATLSYAATVFYPGRWSIDLGNQIELFDAAENAGGVDGARVVGRAPIFEADPDTFVTDDINYYTSMINSATGALSISIGKNLTISAPAGQVVDAYKPASRQGHVTQTLRVGLKRSGGNDEFKLLQGAEA